jgi:uncharacterized membrane protein (DUF2068 family)
MSTIAFRALLLFSLALMMLGNTFDTLFPGFIATSHLVATYAQASSGSGENGSAWTIFIICYLLATLVSVFGLWRNARWSPWLGAVATAAGLIALPFAGFYVVSGFALSIAQLAVGSWFIVLAWAFVRHNQSTNAASAA